jgi:tripartite ATP-independent transporter DctP family solute receptor
MKLKSSLVVLFSICFLFGNVLTSGAQVYKAKVTHPDPTDAPDHLAFMQFKKLVEERSKGQLSVDVHPSAMLGSQREGLEQSQVGGVEIALSSGGIAASFVPEMGLLDVPFLFTTFDEARTSVDSPGMTKLLSEKFAAKGMKFLGFYENGFRNITNNKRPIWSIEDLKGLKIRTMEAPMHMLNFKALGASPTPMAFSEVYTSLQQGVIDGQENPFIIINLEHLYEVQKYLSITNHVYDAMVVVASKKWFDSLPPNLQKIVEDSFRDSVQFEYKMCTDLSDKSLMKLLSTKMQVNAVPPAELAKMKEVGQTAVKKALYEKIDPKTVDWWLSEVDNISKGLKTN